MLLTEGLNAYQKLTEGEFCLELVVRCAGVEGGVVTGGLNAYQSLLKVSSVLNWRQGVQV